MKYMKTAVPPILFIAFFQPMSMEAFFKEETKMIVQGLNGLADKNAPLLEDIAKKVGSEAGKDLVVATTKLIVVTEKLNETTKAALPVIATASAEFGKQFGVDALLLIGDGVGKCTTAITVGAAKVGAAVKTGATIVIASPATPYIVVAVGVAGSGYVVYRVYYYYNPTTGEKILVAEQKAQLYKAKTEVNKAKIELYNSKVEVTEAKMSMMAKVAIGMAAKKAAPVAA